MDALVNIIYKFLFRITAVNNDLYFNNNTTETQVYRNNNITNTTRETVFTILEDGFYLVRIQNSIGMEATIGNLYFSINEQLYLPLHLRKGTTIDVNIQAGQSAGYLRITKYS